MRNLRVLFVINGLGTGGAERSLAELLPRLRDGGVAPIVCHFLSRPEGVEAAVRDAGFDVRLVPARGLPGRVRGLRRVIKRERPAIVHTAIFEADVAGRLAAAGTGAAVMTSLVNATYEPVRLQDPGVRRSRLAGARLLDGWTARHLTVHFPAISEAVRDSAVTTLGIPSERITVIPRGRDPGRLGTRSLQRRRAVRSQLGMTDDDEVLVTVGRQEFQKGQRVLFEALERLVPERPRLVLLLAGRRGAASADLDARLADPALAGRVRMLGHRDDVGDLLAAADLFVFPSLYEGLGGALIEALALGLPVVASDLPAVREVLGDDEGALLAPPGSPDALAVAVRSVLDDPEMASGFGPKNRARFLERFTLDGVAEQMLDLYGRVAAREHVGSTGS
jgi:glycosyltransferase involved in cell wall biosynthesis